MIRTAVSLATIPLLTKLLGLELYGIWTFVSAVVIVVSVAEASVSSVMVRFVARELGGDRENLFFVVAVTSIAMVLVAGMLAFGTWIGSAGIARLMSDIKPSQSVAVVSALKTSSIAIFARMIQQNFVGVVLAFERFRTFNFLATSQVILLNGGMLLIATHYQSVSALMEWQAIVAVLFAVSYCLISVRLLQPIAFVFRCSWAKIKELVDYGAASLLSCISSVMFTQCDRFVVASLLGPVDLGIYGVMTSITGQINNVSALPAQPLLPLISRVQEDVRNVGNTVRRTIRINALVAFGLGTGVYILAPSLLRLLLHTAPQLEIVRSLRILATIYSLYSMNAIGYFILPSVGLIRTSTFLQISTSIATLLLISLGASRLGVAGAALGNGGFILTLSLTFISLRKIGLPLAVWFSRIAMPACLFAGGMILSIALPYDWMFEILAAAAFGAVFFCLLRIEDRTEHNHLDGR